MKHATKMMVVPYVKQIARPQDNYIRDLDAEMSAILQNHKLSIDDKVKLYALTLNRFKEKFDPDDYDDAKKISTNITKAINKVVEPHAEQSTDQEKPRKLVAVDLKKELIIETAVTPIKNDQYSELVAKYDNSRVTTRKQGQRTHPEGLQDRMYMLRNIARNDTQSDENSPAKQASSGISNITKFFQFPK